MLQFIVYEQERRRAFKANRLKFFKDKSEIIIASTTNCIAKKIKPLWISTRQQDLNYTRTIEILIRKMKRA